jgi:uncharacterized membrane protein
LNGDYGRHRLRLFGWIILGLLAALIIGGLVIFALGFAFGFLPFAIFRPFFFFPIGFLIFILFLFLIFRFAFWGWGWGWRRRGYYYYSDSKEILRQRYARGEITKEQFDQMMRDIQDSK